MALPNTPILITTAIVAVLVLIAVAIFFAMSAYRRKLDTLKQEAMLRGWNDEPVTDPNVQFRLSGGSAGCRWTVETSRYVQHGDTEGVISTDTVFPIATSSFSTTWWTQTVTLPERLVLLVPRIPSLGGLMTSDMILKGLLGMLKSDTLADYRAIHEVPLTHPLLRTHYSLFAVDDADAHALLSKAESLLAEWNSSTRHKPIAAIAYWQKGLVVQLSSPTSDMLVLHHLVDLGERLAAGVR